MTSMALRWAIVTSHASTLASAGQVRVGPQGGQERLRPGVVGVGRPEDGPADPQHGRAVHRDDRLERLLAGGHLVLTPP